MHHYDATDFLMFSKKTKIYFLGFRLPSQFVSLLVSLFGWIYRGKKSFRFCLGCISFVVGWLCTAPGLPEVNFRTSCGQSNANSELCFASRFYWLINKAKLRKKNGQYASCQLQPWNSAHETLCSGQSRSCRRLSTRMQDRHVETMASKDNLLRTRLFFWTKVRRNCQKKLGLRFCSKNPIIIFYLRFTKLLTHFLRTFTTNKTLAKHSASHWQTYFSV